MIFFVMFIYYVRMARISPAYYLIFRVVYTRKLQFFSPEYTHHIVTLADFMLEIPGFGSVMYAFCFPRQRPGRGWGFLSSFLILDLRPDNAELKTVYQRDRVDHTLHTCTRMRICVLLSRSYQRGEGVAYGPLDS